MKKKIVGTMALGIFAGAAGYALYKKNEDKIKDFISDVLEDDVDFVDDYDDVELDGYDYDFEDDEMDDINDTWAKVDIVVSEATDKAEESIDEAMDKAEDISKTVKDGAKDVADTVSDKAEETKDKVTE